MAQLTYPTDLTVAYPGMRADNSPRNDVLSRVWENATSAPHGIAVAVGTDPDVQVDHAPDAAGALVGVLQHTHAKEVGSDDQNLVDENDTVNVLHVGRIYVTVEDAFTPADSVFVRVAAGGGGTQLGAFRTDDDTSSARAASGMRFLNSGGAGGLAILEIDPGASLA
jgi:hypothetical protein